MKKVLIATFDNGEETGFHDLLISLEEKWQIGLADNFSADTLLKYGEIEINPKFRTLKRDSVSIELTNYEFDILYLLASHPKQVFSKKQIYEQVWNIPCLGAEDNVVSLIHRIRKKIEPNPAKPIYILTVWGIGYKFSGVLDQ